MDIPETALTHGGKFHADDVFSAALLNILRPGIRISRAFEVPESFDGLVFDLGRGRFDHHQEDSEIRENGVPYAAFGLLWRELGERIFQGCCTAEQAAKEAARFDESFIQPLDEDDNTGCGNPLASVIGSFNPNWDSDRSPDDSFQEAVALATVILNKKFESVRSVLRARTIVEDALAKSEDRIVLLPRFLPWKMVLIPSEAEFVVYPSQRGGYNAQVIPADFGTREVKCNFPEEWAGKTEEELQALSSVRTLSFCHKTRFLISAGCLEDTIKACRIALAQKPAPTDRQEQVSFSGIV